MFDDDDEETRQLILQKTWCHGQLILPIFALFYLVEFFRPTSSHHWNGWFLFAALVLPLWSYGSYTIIITQSEQRNRLYPSNTNFYLLVTGGALVELAHAGILHSVIPTAHTSTLDLLLGIASGLFLIETAAFLCVAWKFGRPMEGNISDQRQRVLYDA